MNRIAYVISLGIILLNGAVYGQNNDVPVTEDLMNEHGVLNRVLLIYEEVIRRIDTKIDFSLKTLEGAVSIVRSFIENYHEKIEETYIFPLFERDRNYGNLVTTLRRQHTKGRQITDEVGALINNKVRLSQKTLEKVRTLLKKFITMYRAHTTREDTVLFRQVRSRMSPQAFKELSQKSDALEQKLFGQQGFARIVQKVAALEKDLNLQALDLFTP